MNLILPSKRLVCTNKTMKNILIITITSYQKYLSPDQGVIPKKMGFSKKTCLFYPSCSEYTKQAIQKYGSIKGSWLGFKRILRCNPFSEPRVDELV